MSSPWAPYTAALTLRDYQQTALQIFTARLEHDTRRFYLVAPPGSGKTLMGLLFAELLGRPAVCLSPNAAIQQQWLQRLRQHWLRVDSPDSPPPPAGDEPGGAEQVLTALTYQRLAVRGDDDGDGDGWHSNVGLLHERLRQAGVGTVILDECHHLSGTWGEACEELCRALDHPFVIGLTATPVDQEQGPLENLLGEPDHAISLPSVVRSGNLATFQDLCQVVPPSADEERDLHGELGRLEALEQRLQHGAGERFSLPVWSDGLELEPRRVDGERLADLCELYAAEPELVTAWCRLRYQAGREPPVDLPYAPEFHEPPTLLDRLQLLAAYTARHLLGDAADTELGAEAAALLEDWGFVVQAGKLRRKPGRISRRLGFSRQKLQAVVSILRTEMAAMDRDLRALVLTDFEFPPAGRPGLSCVDVMQLLTSTPDVDELDPILLTGKSLLVDDDLWQAFAEAFAQLRDREGWRVEVTPQAEQGYWRLQGTGPDWQTRVQVQLVTELLERGLTRCLIGTRALLGEGWDSLRLNTLIDLTVVTSGVAVNQIRGRTLRRDPDNPIKVANNWDVLCLSALGDGTDLQRLRDKHQRLYGVTEDGVVERGLGHLHAGFDRVSIAGLFEQREAINQAMVQRAQDRLAARRRWRVGEHFADQEVQVLSFSARPRSTPARPLAAPEASSPDRRAEPSQLLVRSEDQGRRRQHSLLALGGTALGAAAVTAAALVWFPPLAALAALPLLAGGWWLRQGSRVESAPLDSELSSLAQVLVRALGLQDRVQVELSQRDDGTLRVQWQNADETEAGSLSSALAELLGPVLQPRYLLVETLRVLDDAGALSRLFGRGSETQRVFAVPRALARKREATALLEAWRDLRTAAVELHHQASEAGQRWDQLALHRRPLDGEAAVRAVWK